MRHSGRQMSLLLKLLSVECGKHGTQSGSWLRLRPSPKLLAHRLTTPQTTSGITSIPEMSRVLLARR